MRYPVATINYNGSKDTVQLIRSLSESGESFDLIIVDNRSPKTGEVGVISDYVCDAFHVQPAGISYEADRVLTGCRFELNDRQRVTVIEADSNYGFSGGTNIGLRYAIETYPEAEFLTILNNDTEVTPGFLSEVTDKMDKYDLAAAMGTILYFDAPEPTIWSIGGPISFWKGQGIHERKDTVFVPGSVQDEVVFRRFISGCFTVFRRDPLISIGLLDEDYFFAGEEYQYSYELSRKNRIGWVPKSVIYHKSVLGVGNGSSHDISEMKWKYNAYMVKIVFVNKNRSALFRFLWHIVFRLYVSLKLKKRFIRDGYQPGQFDYLKRSLFSHIHETRFSKEDFDSFAAGLKDWE
ncbi:MAG: glycosyltransferase [Lachnospiraceae bacterium]|nr:glycosyltransferase [Lachnospiraceae bacterium]